MLTGMNGNPYKDLTIHLENRPERQENVKVVFIIEIWKAKSAKLFLFFKQILIPE